MQTPKKRAERGRADWPPRKYLKFAEDQAVKTAKSLVEFRERNGLESVASVDDAVQLANLVADLAALGQKETVDQAIWIADHVERLLDLLATEIDELIASNK